LAKVNVAVHAEDAMAELFFTAISPWKAPPHWELTW
jgi:hypothetical protein